MAAKPLVLPLATAVILVVCVPRAAAHGDIVVPQIADGRNVDGTLFKTKFDIANLGVVESISNVKLLFFRQDGTAWPIVTNQGTGAELTIRLGRLQTVRIETNGSSATLSAGYAIIRNTEIASTFAEDFEISVSVFYEVSRSTGVVDTVSVPTAQPTLSFSVSIETDVSRNLLSGFAIVNLDTSNSNKVDLRLWNATTPSSSDPSDFGTVSFTLNAGEQRARFLNESGLYASRSTTKGLLVGVSERPVAIVALLQTPVAGGVQYATLVASNRDALRTSTYMYLRQDFAIDADIPQVDYFGNVDENLSWDVLYQTQDDSSRRLLTKRGAVSGTYMSGGTVIGSTGQACRVVFNRDGGGTGGEASVVLTGTNTIASGTALTNLTSGYGYTSAPMTATLDSFAGGATCSDNAVVRTALGGATIASIGTLTDEEFDAVTLSELQAGSIRVSSTRTISLSFGAAPVSLNNGSSNLAIGYALAVKTALGRYAKIRVADVITRGTDTTKRDLALEVYVYR